MSNAAAELIGALLGTLFLTLGLAAMAVSALRAERRDRALLWFGIATALYGARLIVRSEAVRAIASAPEASWTRVEDLITYVIIIPGALFVAATLPTARRGVLRALWRVNLAAAIVAVAIDLRTGRTGAAMPLNQVVVVVNIVALLTLAAIDVRSRRPTRDASIVLAGVGVFAATALYETIRGGVFVQIDLEPLAMVVLVGCLGYVIAKRMVRSERRMAAVERELETARRIQQSILPKAVPSLPGLAVAAHYESMSAVAGDLYDFVVTASGRLGVLVADVSGHGVPAALVASMVKMALAAQHGDVDDPGAVLTRMNRALCGQFDLAYVTAVFAIADPEAGTLTYASAGHPPPVLVRRGGREIETLDARGIVLGFAPADYASTVVRNVGPGDRFVLYTDGLTEAARPDGEFFGDRAFRERLGALRPDAPDRAVDDLVDTARAWAGRDFADDVTVVVVDWTG
jgi:sigma-B regulation protein RsbU (phosphoserine phosphatase)